MGTHGGADTHISAGVFQAAAVILHAERLCWGRPGEKQTAVTLGQTLVPLGLRPSALSPGCQVLVMWPLWRPMSSPCCTLPILCCPVAWATLNAQHVQAKLAQQGYFTACLLATPK